MLLDNVGVNALASVLFAVLGFVLLYVGFRLFDVVTPADIAHKVFEEGNVAAALVVASFVIAMALIIASAIS
jgi:uncharacterized membrane protein YjfL (UPF0719 family)